MKVRSAADIGALIRSARQAKGWDQQVLADKIGVSRLWVGEAENGKTGVRLDLVLRALEAAGLDLTITDSQWKPVPLHDDELDQVVGGAAPVMPSAALIERVLRDRS